MLLDNKWINNETNAEIKTYLETNEDEHTTAQNLWDTVKAVLRGKFIALQAYLKKQEKSPINNLTLFLEELEKEQQENPRVSKRKKIIKIREEINDMETIKKYKRSMEPMEYKRSRVLWNDKEYW